MNNGQWSIAMIINSYAYGSYTNVNV